MNFFKIFHITEKTTKNGHPTGSSDFTSRELLVFKITQLSPSVRKSLSKRVKKDRKIGESVNCK